MYLWLASHNKILTANMKKKGLLFGMGEFFVYSKAPAQQIAGSGLYHVGFNVV